MFRRETANRRIFHDIGLVIPVVEEVVLQGAGIDSPDGNSQKQQRDEVWFNKSEHVTMAFYQWTSVKRKG